MRSGKYPSFFASASTIFLAQLSAFSSDITSSKLFLMDVSGQKSPHSAENEKSVFIKLGSTFCANTWVAILSTSEIKMVPVLV